MHNQKGFINVILLIIAILVFLGAGIYIALYQKIINPFPLRPNPIPVACTQEAKQCPDGSYVSRTGPNCDFASCPTIHPTQNPNEKQISLQEGQREASLLVQKIYSDYVTGLNYPEYPVATNQGYPITLHIGETASNGCTITLTLIKINGDTAVFTEKTDFNRICPICLAKNTLINTPGGTIPVQNLQEGMAVWSVDEFGNKISAIITKTSKTPVPKDHQMVHIILKDKREIFASPGHPVGDGRIFNDLFIGDLLDGSRIITAEKTLYDKSYTYDILPSGPTGFYFAGYNTAPGSANGILIDNTLH